jgi:hypothetical protein
MLPARSRNRIGEVGFGARAVWGDISKFPLKGFLWASMPT